MIYGALHVTYILVLGVLFALVNGADKSRDIRRTYAEAGRHTLANICSYLRCPISSISV